VADESTASHAKHGSLNQIFVFAGYTTLRAFVDRMEALPTLREYLASPRRIPMTVNDEAKAPWSSDGYVRFNYLTCRGRAQRFDPSARWLLPARSR
jgi:hypothetical protein